MEPKLNQDGILEEEIIEEEVIEENQDSDEDSGDSKPQEPEKNDVEVWKEKAEEYRRQAQSNQDKLLNLMNQQQTLLEKLQSGRQAPDTVTQKSMDETEELIDELRDHFGEIPALEKLARSVSEVKKFKQEIATNQTVETSNSVLSILNEFAAANGDKFINEEIKVRFNDEVADRLPMDIVELTQKAQQGYAFDKEFVKNLKGKLDRSLSAVTGKTVVSSKKIEAETRKKDRSTNNVVNPVDGGAVKPDIKMSYRDALKACRNQL